MSTLRKLLKVFVYGTLKKNQPNHYWLQKNEKGHASFLCDGVTANQFPLLVATKYNVPFLIDMRGKGQQVSGEIYEIDELMLANLDELEDYPQLYDRIITNVHGSDGKVHDCYTYTIKKYPVEFLTDYTFLREYENSIEKPYLETYLESCSPEHLFSSTETKF